MTYSLVSEGAGVSSASAPPPNPPKRPRRTGSTLILRWSGVFVALAAWQLIPTIGLVDPRYVPPLSVVLEALARIIPAPQFWSSLGATLRGWGLGLAIAVVLAVTIGVGIASSRFLTAATASTIEFLRPIPSVAFIPLVVLLYGTDMRATLVLVVYASFWPVLLQVMSGVADVDPVALDTSRSFRFRTGTRVARVIWPSALPFAMTGIRLSATIALVVEITGELVIGSPGLGREIAAAQSAGAVPMLYALVLVAGVIGVAVNSAARVAERRFLHWHQSVRAEAS